MKKTLLILFTICSALLFAQEIEMESINVSKVKKQSLHSDKSSVVIWEEDFGNGFPSGWGNYTVNTGAGNNGATSAGNTAECPWKHSFQGSWGYWNSVGTNAAGNPVSAAAPINSTTASNGFLISDLDSANHWNGNPGSNSGSTYHYIESYFITSAIDLTGWSNVSVEFEHNFRLNNSINLVVSISSDSISWTDYNVQGTATNNQASADPEYMSLNISSVAGNQPTVYVKVGWTGRVYYWMIDDMKIVETPNNKIDLSEATTGGWYTTPPGVGQYAMDYTYYPIKQATANPYTFEGIVTNLGALNQTTRLHVEAYNDMGLNVFSTTSPDVVLTSQDTATLVGSDQFTPSEIGPYQFDVWASSDSTISDTISRYSIVTENVYGRDDNNDYSWYGLGRSCGGMVIGTYFDVYDSDDVESISVFLKGTTVPGSQIYAALYEIDANGGKIYLTQSDDYTVTSADTNNWVSIPFSSGYQLFSGITYMAAVGGYANPVDTSVIGMAQYTYPATCYIQKNGCLNTGQTFGNWYWTSRVPMIRMNFVIVSSVDEDVFNGRFMVYPNPTNNILNIEMHDVDDQEYSISITNILGEKIYERESSIISNFKEVIDLSRFSKGIYFVQASNSESSITRKVVLE